jgi:hypothetical protein
MKGIDGMHGERLNIKICGLNIQKRQFEKPRRGWEIILHSDKVLTPYIWVWNM